MKLHINLRQITNNSYDIIIGKNLSSVAKEIARDAGISKYFIITDTNVKKLYGNEFLETLQSYQADAYLLSVSAGEKSKDRKTKEQLEDRLLKLKADRSSVIIALGGGMIGDLAGFVASTWMRGIPFIQIPTTLLSQVDSSIGGKVAVDHPFGKNLIGAFYQPKKVYIDTGTLKTLPLQEFRNGIAEVIKYAAILDSNMFSFLEDNQSKILLQHRSCIFHIIHRCCELKKMIVEKDEKETGLRRILNFGHTIGHAVESLSKFRLSHGEAVAIGMIAEARISFSLGLLNKSDVERLINLIGYYMLPTEIPDNVGVRNILKATMLDKKVIKGKVQYTLLEKIGKAAAGVSVSQKAVERILSK